MSSYRILFGRNKLSISFWYKEDGQTKAYKDTNQTRHKHSQMTNNNSFTNSKYIDIQVSIYCMCQLQPESTDMQEQRPVYKFSEDKINIKKRSSLPKVTPSYASQCTKPHHWCSILHALQFFLYCLDKGQATGFSLATPSVGSNKSLLSTQNKYRRTLHKQNK